jgi:hypothetical protein
MHFSTADRAAAELPKRPPGISDADEARVREASEKKEGQIDYSRENDLPPLGVAYEFAGGLGYMSFPEMELPEDESDPPGILAHAGLGVRIGSRLRVLADVLYLDAKDDEDNARVFESEIGVFGVLQVSPMPELPFAFAAGVGFMQRGDWAQAHLLRAIALQPLREERIHMGLQVEWSDHGTSSLSLYCGYGNKR